MSSLFRTVTVSALVPDKLYPYILRLVINCYDYNSDTPGLRNMDTFDIVIILHIRMLKQILYNITKLLLILLIFCGLQGRVLVRYAEIFKYHTGHEMYTQKGTNVQAEVVHCKLQCFTEQFHFMAIPGIPYLLTFILFNISLILVFLPFGEEPVSSDIFKQSYLRGPPLFN